MEEEEILETKDVLKGLVDVVVDYTKISYINGKKGVLYYRGYPIELLVEHCTFEEVAFLLLFGNLPAPDELHAFEKFLKSERYIPDNVISILKSFPLNTTRIEILRTAVSALALYDKDDKSNSENANFRKGMRIIAKLPTILAYAHRIQSNLPIVEPSSELSHAANFYYMMTNKIPSPEVESAFDKVLTVHAEHDINASTFAARITVSTLSDLYSGTTSAIGTLKGPLHGGANEAVIRYWLDDVKKIDNVIPWAENKLANKEKIMGFGHRVYKTYDPRAVIFKNMAKEFWNLAESDPDFFAHDEFDVTIHEKHDEDIDNLYEMSEILENYMIEQKNVYPNMDFYSAILLHALGVPTPLFTPIFAAARTAGWTAHMMEQLKENKIIRPRLRYIGDPERAYIEPEERKRATDLFFACFDE
jgi:citrate synthase